MAQRVAWGALAVLAAIAIVVLDVGIAESYAGVAGPIAALLRRGSVVPLVWLALILCGAVELNRMLRLTGARPYRFLAYALITLLVLSPWASAAGWMGHGAAQVEGLYWLIVWLIGGGVASALVAVYRRDPSGTLRDAGATWLMIGYLGVLGAVALQLRCGRDMRGQDGAWLFLLTALITKASDIGAYLVGSSIGRHKLIPSISPGKSVEGAIGGLLASAGAAVLFTSLHAVAAEAAGPASEAAVYGFGDKLAGIVADATRALSHEYSRNGIPPIWRALLFGAAMSAVGQVGDLFESCFKRDAGIKDSASYLPGFGGSLDLLDSVLLALPVAWFLLATVWSVV